MPPYVPRKRVRNVPPPKDGDSKEKATTSSPIAPRRKPTLFDDLDATSTPRSSVRSSTTRQLIDDSDDDSSSLSSLSDADFEDVPMAKRRKVDPEDEQGEVKDDDDDDLLEFEDVQAPQADMPDAPLPLGDLELTLTRDTRISLTNDSGKKGPSKLERKIRVATHCVHVQFLLWHNAIRNSWLCDPEVQGLLLSHLPPKLWDEVDRWRRNSGLELLQETAEKPPASKAKGKEKAKSKNTRDKSSRDWGDAAQHLERDAVDMSHGDPLFRLMKALSAWWKQRFRISAPGLRKVGYMSLERLDRLTEAYNSGESDAARFGERFDGLEEFRRCARDCTGSRDVGSQLFTSLLRALALDARMVANLQPLGFGWNKLEEAEPERENTNTTAITTSSKLRIERNASEVSPRESKISTRRSRTTTGRAVPEVSESSTRQTSRRSSRAIPKDIDDFELLADDSDESVIEIPEAPPTKKGQSYDKDLEFPHYWTEVLSPVTKKRLPVDPIVKSVIATNRELVESLEPRGNKADKAKQVMAYIVGYSQDGTAKDVTVRYLKRQMLPGRTKGSRMPVEKIPVHDRNGRVKRYDKFDWFKSVMRGYGRGNKKNPITEIDEEEDSTDLKPVKQEQKEVKDGEETLQYYKQSKEFVLERHLKREEALLPTAIPVKTFRNKGKSSDGKGEPVFSRKDVVQVKSAETWHKQGRAPLPGEEPLKKVPYRAATTNRRREIAEAEAVTGEKVLQGLYSFDQTDWIIPPPIKDGIIPKNEYGNIDLFVEHMCPKGAVHVPYRGTVRVCKRLGIDYAEAVVDFEFGHRMAVPVIQGVVIAEEYHDQVMEELAKDEAERTRKEDEKRRKAALAMWRKFLMGMRIMERIRQDYGDIKGDVEVFGHNRGPGDAAEKDDEDMAGGFLPEGYESEGEKAAHQVSGFFPVIDEDDDDGEDTLHVENDSLQDPPAQEDESPINSRMSTRPTRKEASKAKAFSSRRRRRRVSPSDDEDDEEYGETDDDYNG